MKTSEEIQIEQNRKLINLYRKNRDIEVQKKIEKIFLETDNTALRIKLIEKLDKENDKTISNSIIKKEKKESKNKENIKKKQSKNNNLKVPITDKKNVEFKNLLENFLEKTTGFLGMKQKVKWFLKNSKTLEYSFFKLSLSKKTVLFFSEIQETKITNILRLFDYFRKDGWLFWEPYVYNYFYNLYLFLDEFFQVKFWLKEDLDLEQCIKKTLKMQYHYAVYLNEKIDREEMMHKSKNFILRNKDFMQKQNFLSEIFYFMDNLEKSNIKLTEIIRAFYICNEKKMFYWEDIVKKLKPISIDKKKFSNQESAFQNKISLRILKIKNTIKQTEEENTYIETIKKDYFTFKQEQIDISFIQELILDYIEHYYYSKSSKTDELKDLYLSRPICLLEIILEHISSYDFLINSRTELLNPVDNKVIMSKIIDIPGFHAIFKKLKTLKESLKDFIKINSNFKYSFDDLEKRITKADKKYLKVLSICDDSVDIFWKLAKDFDMILKNHSQALSQFKKQDEKTLYSKKTIKKIENKPQFIPYYNYKILKQKLRLRLRQTNIPDILHSATKLLYNSIYIYRDSYMIKCFDKKNIIIEKDDLQNLYKEYKRLTQQEYEKE